MVLILVIDNNPDWLRSSVEVLQEFGYVVLSAPSLAAAREEAHERRCRLGAHRLTHGRRQ